MGPFIQRIIRKAQQSFRHRGVVATLARGVAAPYFILRDYKRLPQDFDWKYGVDTDGWIPMSTLEIASPNREYGTIYSPTRPQIFYEALAGLNIDYRDFVFVDMGSGKGRIVLLASELPFKEIIGIEFSPQLNRIAEQNMHRYKSQTQRCKNIRLECADFTVYPIPKDPVMFFFYHPCKGPVMEALIQHIRDSVVTNPRKIYILYVNPELSSMIEAAGFVSKIKEGDKFALYSNSR